MLRSVKKRLKTEQTPLIDGNVVTFIWKGKDAPNLIGDFTGWDPVDALTMQSAGPGYWTYQHSFPSDAYIEYAFQRGDENLLDPLNSRISSNGMGGYNNSFSMPEHTHSNLSIKAKQIPHGMLTSYNLPTDNFLTSETRGIHLYQPPVKEPVPLLVVWDGQDYHRRMHLTNIIDNMIAQKRIHPLALALVKNGGQKSRTVEYGCSEATIVFLMTEVLPLAVHNLNLIDITSVPGAYGVAGASMGGLMALYTGARLPQIFGRVLSQSGAFSLAGLDMVVFDMLNQEGQNGLNIWLDVGIYDIPGLLTANQRMRDTLIQNNYAFGYHEYNGGHNYPAWGDDIWRGLEFLFGNTGG